MKLPATIILSVFLVATGCAPSSERLSSPSEAMSQTEASRTVTKTRISSHSFDDTVSRVNSAIGKRPLNLFAKIDHSAGAGKAGLSLSPSTLFIFGNPKGGTPLMQRNPEMGIVLPLKIHVFQDGETVKVNYTDIEMEARLHGLDTRQQPIPNIIKMLDGLTTEVTVP